MITEIVAFVTLQDRNVSSTLVLSGLSHPILEENCNNVGGEGCQHHQVHSRDMWLDVE
ncbi:hypothetical protein [Anaplasma phagocytophilum]|uniref:hypothetical protein n=1 Tax=Anaplasma phagocytophilum TaxID=948 RepID=UPI00200D67E2|nr:hypothetical protein [Anaplasma phagocytophilum]